MRSLVFEALGAACELYAVEPREPLEATGDWIRALHHRLTRFEPDSELSRFNARAGEWVEVSPELRILLQLALDAFEESGGLVNAAILPALIAAGYDRTLGVTRGERSVTTHVNPHQIDADSHQIDAKTHAPLGRGPVPPLPDLLQVRLGAARLASGGAVDLGGIAKGWIADRAVERLGPNSLANCGGDLYASGGGTTGEGWPVGFGDRTVLLRDLGAATSGTTKRRWGEGRHHLIDPRTGAPAVSDLQEVSVLAETAVRAEVLAKTALLLGSAAAAEHLAGRSAGWALS